MPDTHERDAAIVAIRCALRRRSGRNWSVTGGRGTTWGWITITSPPSRRDEHGCLTAEDAAELAALLGLPTVHFQGQAVRNGQAARREFVARAEGRTDAAAR